MTNETKCNGHPASSGTKYPDDPCSQDIRECAQGVKEAFSKRCTKPKFVDDLQQQARKENEMGAMAMRIAKLLQIVCLGVMAQAVTLSASSASPEADKKPIAKVRFQEVARSILFAPMYVAIAKNHFKEVGLDVALGTAQGTDKGMAALLSNSADVVLIGPEAAVYVHNSNSPVKPKIFAGLIATDCFVLMSREKINAFSWELLKGQNVLGYRPGSSPLLFFHAALKKHGLDPDKDVKLANNISIPARVGAWLSGQDKFGIFFEPEVSVLEKDGKAHAILSIGNEVGQIDYTVFMATEGYIEKNPKVISAWVAAIKRAQAYLQNAPTAELTKLLSPYFPGLDAKLIEAALDRYRGYNIWKRTPEIQRDSFERLQTLLINGHVMKEDARIKYEAVVASEFFLDHR